MPESPAVPEAERRDEARRAATDPTRGRAHRARVHQRLPRAQGPDLRDDDLARRSARQVARRHPRPAAGDRRDPPRGDRRDRRLPRRQRTPVRDPARRPRDRRQGGRRRHRHARGLRACSQASAGRAARGQLDRSEDRLRDRVALQRQADDDRSRLRPPRPPRARGAAPLRRSGHPRVLSDRRGHLPRRPPGAARGRPRPLGGARRVARTRTRPSSSTAGASASC